MSDEDAAAPAWTDKRLSDDEDAAAPAWTEAEIVEGLHAHYLTVDEVIAGVTARTAVPCRRGCSQCCHDVPPALSRSEWLVVVEHLRSMPREQVRPTLQRALELYEQHRDWLEAVALEPERADELARQHSYTCPFLVEEACSIYPARPHACRLYGNAYVSSLDKLYGCHLVEEALLDQEPALVHLESTLAMLRLYPGTRPSRPFPWYVAHHLPEDLGSGK